MEELLLLINGKLMAEMLVATAQPIQQLLLQMVKL
jgi:hypothetical protein